MYVQKRHNDSTILVSFCPNISHACMNFVFSHPVWFKVKCRTPYHVYIILISVTRYHITFRPDFFTSCTYFNPKHCTSLCYCYKLYLIKIWTDRFEYLSRQRVYISWLPSLDILFPLPHAMLEKTILFQILQAVTFLERNKKCYSYGIIWTDVTIAKLKSYFHLW